jgi:serine/threonine-protein kinase HipA
MGSEARERLRVFLNDELLGELERQGPTRYRLHFDPQAVERHGEGSIVLSTSLPLRDEAYPNGLTKPFFEGLLPEGVARREVARSVGVSETNGFGLLGAIGVDCAGAVVVLPPGVDRPAAGEILWLNEEQIAERLRDLPNHPLGVDPEEGIRLSLGGVQQKLIVTRAASGAIGQPKGGAPSTHIIKPNQAGYTDIVANEAYGLRVARCAGLAAAKTEIVRYGEIDALLVERYDRTIAGDGRIVRLHQEDMCQALGILPSAKYENEGGPSLAAIFDLLREIGTARDLNSLTRAALISFLLGNSDAHGKNYSLLYTAGTVRLAPLYDIVSTAVYPGLTKRLAMSIAGKDDPDDIDQDAWLEMLRDNGFRPQARQLESDVAEIVQCSVSTLNVARAEGWHRPVLDEIHEVLRTRAGQLSAAEAIT